MLHLQGPENTTPIIILHWAQLVLTAEKREKETKGCRQWRSSQQSEVPEQPQEQVGGRTEAGDAGEVAHQVQEVAV